MTLFEKLLLAHFIGDWIMQPHSMAIQKTENWKVRFVHCCIVTACFWWIPWYWMAWIFVSHFAIDTYKPLYWFRRMRRDFSSYAEFKESFKTPSGFMVNIVFDQLFHVLCLVPIVTL